MNILVTGTDGYIGTLLTAVLTERGHDVTGLDTGFYKIGWLYDGVPRRPTHICKDIRQVQGSDLAGFDAVVHLAELSNDPVGQLNPDLTFEINHLGTVRLATLAQQAGVQRFVYFSSCSVYGATGDGSPSTEESPTNPLTAYAQCKLLVERDLADMACDSFSPIFLRNATAYGPSPRMRFDLVVNNLAGLAWTSGRLVLESDGTPWRPFVHVLDICQAAACALEAPREVVHKQAMNVGDDEENYQVRDIARIVSEAFPDCELVIGANPSDKRDYRVSFAKIRRLLPTFRCRYRVADGARQLREVFESVAMDNDTFDFRGYTRLKQIRYLLETGQVDRDLFWQVPSGVR
ncbi:MAG: SDR family oxidoreductase [Gloeobacterales cyanobacterium]